MPRAPSLAERQDAAVKRVQAAHPNALRGDAKTIAAIEKGLAQEATDYDRDLAQAQRGAKEALEGEHNKQIRDWLKTSADS